MSATSLDMGLDISPHAVMEAVYRGCDELDVLGREIASGIQRLAVSERHYERAMQAAKLALFDEYRDRGERLPAEDLRTAIAHSRVNGNVYGDFLSAKALVDALKARARTVEASLSGRQTLLGILKAELSGRS